MTESINNILGRVSGWMFDAALPLWLEHGVEKNGLFHEQLDFAGKPDPSSPRRMRVQARQLYVFNQAALLGVPVPAETLERCFDSFLTRCWSPDGRPGWIHLLSPDGSPGDTKRDAYDHAFGLFALSYVYRNTGDERAKSLALDTLSFMDRDMAHPAGGYREGLPESLPRRSNPHMHFFEAMLAWYEATKDVAFLERANGIIDLFLTRFYDLKTSTYREYFDETLKIMPGPEGEVVEPGHHFEWIWLLTHAAQLGARDACAEVRNLYDFALRYGLDDSDLAIDECNARGGQVRQSRRLWPQTELIKANIAMGDVEGAALVANLVLDSYLATEVPGLWMDQFDEHGRGITKMVPASSLYHLVVAFRELLDAGRNQV